MLRSTCYAPKGCCNNEEHRKVDLTGLRDLSGLDWGGFATEGLGVPMKAPS